MTLSGALQKLPLRHQLMAVFATLSIATTAITALTLASVTRHEMNDGLRHKAVQYARLLQRQLAPALAFDDHLTAREVFESLMDDRDVDGLGVYNEQGEMLEGRGARPSTLPSIDTDLALTPGHAIAVAEIKSREGRSGRLFVSLTSNAIIEAERRHAWFAAGIAVAVVLCALVLAARTSRRIASRLGTIAIAANRMAAGDLTHATLDDSGKDEVGALAHAFNTMVDELNRMSAVHNRQVETERERLEGLVSERTQALQQSREMFKLIAESTKAIPFTLNVTHGFFPYIGAQGIANFDVPEEQWREPGALDRVIPRSSNPETRQRFDECPAGPFEFLTTLNRSNGQQAEVRWMGTCETAHGEKTLRGLTLDVTEMRRLARELTAAQKLESVGRLAAGVAHEINTPVQFVMDNIGFVSDSISGMTQVINAYRELKQAVQTGGDAAALASGVASVEIAADLDYALQNVPPAIVGAIEGLERIATIVRSMKEFAHPDQTEMTSADLNHAIESTLVIARNEYKYVAEVETHFGELPPVQCYLGEVNQVILNLLVNAAHAIADVVEDSGTMGTLTVRTRLDGDEVEIAIGDTGTGIPEAAREQVFDPFFTTKEVGKGTGQGLAIARSVIVNKHRGTLRFETECGRGTTFFIRLPVGAHIEDLSAPQVAA